MLGILRVKSFLNEDSISQTVRTYAKGFFKLSNLNMLINKRFHYFPETRLSGLLA